MGKKWFAVIACIDILKGMIIILLNNKLTGTEYYAGVALLALILGHIYPIQLNFKGGKGVACLIGGLSIITPLLSLTLIGVFIICYILSHHRYRLSGVSTIALLPIFSYLFNLSTLTVITLTLTTVLVLYTYYRMSQINITNDTSKKV